MSMEQKVKQSIHDSSRQIAKEVAVFLNKEIEPDALDLIAELTYKKMVMWGQDLDAFAKHAKRTQINPDDVKLLVRRNSSLKETIDQKIADIASNKPAVETTNGTKRKRKATASTSTA